MDRQDVINEIIDYLTKSGVKKIALFGSFARSQEGPRSDIDIIGEAGHQCGSTYARLRVSKDEAVYIKVNKHAA